MAKDKEKQDKGKNVAFVLSIGDEGAILITMNKNTLLKRIFISNPSEPALEQTLATYPKAPIYVFVDVVDQSYIRHTMPPVNRSNVKKLAKRKLQKDFADDDLKTTIPIGQEKSGKKEWTYLFVAARYISPLSDWIEQVAEFSNPFKGVYMLPIECMKHIKDYLKIVAKERRKQPGEWQIIVSHNRVGGFRQTVFYKEKTVFTRIVQPVGGKEPDVIAGHIEQETQNTLEYIRRLGFDENQGLDLFVLTSSAVREALEQTRFETGERFVFTPYELSQKLNIHAADQKDRYADVILAAHFLARGKPVFRFATPYIQRIDRNTAYVKAIKAAMLLCIIASLGVMGKMVNDGLSLQDNLQRMLAQKNAAQEKLNQYRNFNEEFGDQAQKILDLIDKHEQLGRNQYDLFDILQKFIEIDGFNYVVVDFDFRQNNQGTQTGRNRGSQRQLNQGNEGKYLTTFVIEFQNKSNQSLDKLLDEIDLFTNEVRRKFADYNTRFEGLPSDASMAIDFANNDDATTINNRMTIELQIDGPIENEET